MQAQIIAQRDLRPGDVVSIHSPGAPDSAYSTATVLTIQEGLVRLQRPYITWEPRGNGFCKLAVESFAVFQDSGLEWTVYRREES